MNLNKKFKSKRIQTMNETETFFNNLSEAAKNLILADQSIIMSQLSEAIKDAASDGEEEGGIRVIVVLKITGPQLACRPLIETSRTVRRRNEGEIVTADSTPDMFKGEFKIARSHAKEAGIE